jgi:hypothetical protein
MTAKLLIREVGQREFVQHNGDFLDTEEYDANGNDSGVTKAGFEGERLCAEGNVEAFQVWELVTTKQRVWKLEEVAA